ncbi:uncharacterized protein LOC127035422 isoform X1 [Gopherus flavomarginatus]|uniref:uncharacterized protein LOC127035422 isoform X1 n=1 Tax=Gopherus flavomarginatus TaxID=286002 RepID=UPI0021CC3596|nr:uncharacterized protein LOC127035422 isoform X1 [Gopherus flavomarginatus]
MLSLVNNGAYAYCSVICFSMEPVTSNCILPPGQGPHTHGGEQNNHVPATLYPIVKVLSKHDQRENKLKRKREEKAEKENLPASVTDGQMKPSMGNLSENTVVSATRTPPPEPPKKLKRKREETTEKENLPASVTDGQMKPSMGNLSENAVVSATSTPPPEELPKNQKSALRPLTTQNSTEVQMKHPGSPDLIYVKPKDKTKDSGKKQPHKHNSCCSAATATPSPEKTVSENAHVHKPRARTLGVLKVRKPGACGVWAPYKKPRSRSFCDAKVLQPHTHNSSSSAATATASPEKTVKENAHVHKPGACAPGVVNKTPSTDKTFSQNHKLATAPPSSSVWEEFDASIRKVMDAVSSGSLKERPSRKTWEKYDALFRAMLKDKRAEKGVSEQA